MRDVEGAEGSVDVGTLDLVSGDLDRASSAEVAAPVTLREGAKGPEGVLRRARVRGRARGAARRGSRAVGRGSDGTESHPGGGTDGGRARGRRGAGGRARWHPTHGALCAVGVPRWVPSCPWPDRVSRGQGSATVRPLRVERVLRIPASVGRSCPMPVDVRTETMIDCPREVVAAFAGDLCASIGFNDGCGDLERGLLWCPRHEPRRTSRLL